MSKKKIKLNIDEIRSKKQKLIEELEKLKQAKEKSTTRMLLDEISDVIKMYIQQGLSYRKISKAIYNTYSIRISESTIRAYTKNVLGIERKKASNSTENNSYWESNDKY